VQFLLEELICSTNLSFGTYPGLSHGAYNALALHASDALKALFLPKLVDGTWAGTMCLTEPQCGTDLGLIRTKAEPSGTNGPDGTPAYRITGTKIFISAGEHDLTDNILHLVLAKLPDAPAGTRGISLFLVPKVLVAADGTPGARNAVACGALEHKMGIKASATCVMNFDGAEGYLVGAPHSGMRAMFTMMNVARLAVGIQGLGLAETAYQSAAAYARERLQGRALSGPKHPELPADPILVHPDVRRNLLTMRAYIEGARALAVWVAFAVDVAERHPDAARRQEADDLVALLTPLVKAFFTDMGFEATNLGMQVFGGHGYIREHGMEQLVRDARIAQLYEGTNGIQALDLVRRKLAADAGATVTAMIDEMRAFDGALGEVQDSEALAVIRAMEGDRLVERAARLGAAFLGLLRGLAAGGPIREVRGRGMMFALEFADRAVCDRICEGLLERGYIVGNRGGTLRIDPPLTIAEADFHAFVDTLGDLLAGEAAPA